MRVVLYFGSFNPIHIGHVNVAKYTIQNQLADEVWFVVSPCNPFKEKESLLDEKYRLEMVTVALRQEPKLRACDVELNMPVPSYTFDTLCKLKDQYPEDVFSLLIGSDNALLFNQWKNYDQILESFTVFVYPRSGYDFHQVSLLYPKMKLLSLPTIDISSTQIRKARKLNMDFLRKWLEPSVFDYIVDKDLYSTE